MKKTNSLITGGSGFLGRALTQQLLALGGRVTWASRHLDIQRPDAVEVIGYDELLTTDRYFDIIINLAGANVGDKRWTVARKKILYDSRLQPTQAVIDYIARATVRPRLLISSSAIGWYGTQAGQLTEASDYHDEFTHQLCAAWEELALTAEQYAVDTVIIRTGLVMSPTGGIVKRLKWPFALGLGGKLGNGQQMISWISREDWVRAVLFIVERQQNQQPVQRLYNLSNPVPISNAQLTQALGKWLKRPTVFTQPRTLLRWLLGEMSVLLLEGQTVFPKHLLDEGFTFLHSHIDEVLCSES